MDLFSPESITALVSVIGIDLVLAGDNAIVIGMAASGLPPKERNKAIMVGIIAATILRICFAVLATKLLAITGLLLAGGILLLWVCWKMWREIRHQRQAQCVAEGLQAGVVDCAPSVAAAPGQQKTFAQAAWQIVIADISMSLDNVLAVAGAAREHPWVLVFGLGLSVAMMGLAASLIAGLLNKYRWIAYVGLLIILYVALDMVWRGWHEVAPIVAS